MYVLLLLVYITDMENDHNAEILGLKASHEKEITQLKTENYVLSTKVSCYALYL